MLYFLLNENLYFHHPLKFSDVSPIIKYYRTKTIVLNTMLSSKLDFSRFTPHYKNLFRAIARWCPDSSTFLSFALSCKLAALCCQEFSALKQYEFSKIVLAKTIKTRILPNGFWHGLQMYNVADVNACCTFANGKWVQTVNVYKNNLNHIPPLILDHTRQVNNELRRVQSVGYIVIDKTENKEIQLSNSHTVIQSSYCPCKTFHRFTSGRFLYYRGCRETEYSVRMIEDTNFARRNNSLTRRQKLYEYLHGPLLIL
jgi:hypothetical protein